MRLLWWSLNRLGGLVSVGSRRLVSRPSVHKGHLWPRHSMSTFHSLICYRFAHLLLCSLTLHFLDQGPCAFPLPSLSFLFLSDVPVSFRLPPLPPRCLVCLVCCVVCLFVCSVSLPLGNLRPGDKCMGSGPHQISLSSLPFLASPLFPLCLFFCLLHFM